MTQSWQTIIFISDWKVLLFGKIMRDKYSTKLTRCFHKSASFCKYKYENDAQLSGKQKSNRITNFSLRQTCKQFLNLNFFSSKEKWTEVLELSDFKFEFYLMKKCESGKKLIFWTCFKNLYKSIKWWKYGCHLYSSVSIFLEHDSLFLWSAPLIFQLLKEE